MYYHTNFIFVKLPSHATPHAKDNYHRSNNTSSNSMVDADWGYGNTMTIAMAMELF